MKPKLTPAQQRVLDALPTDGTFTDAYKLCRQRRTRQKLNNIGATEPARNAGGSVVA